MQQAMIQYIYYVVLYVLHLMRIALHTYAKVHNASRRTFQNYAGVCPNSVLLRNIIHIKFASDVSLPFLKY
jgi:hypothetical protein